ncbi:hypothetical protein VTN96DRAFT_2787 [Rasamsonia emersonii]|uniref:Uncharacterized protein n=1 Tax=Rasamsonia emersonii (strain ATCC 16479 / CBS 393.64 / IMI 116815) TaxID=1408163 RepID=A0A0F4Z2E3_RASE3|nr:Uncharacterized protein T310_1441 [Rasamsonia emersonii CBS 393.64]KKA24540.1 Uncharacterized protein T310_1441 [Rasamsonia emersonii CBS 393.64]
MRSWISILTFLSTSLLATAGPVPALSIRCSNTTSTNTTTGLTTQRLLTISPNSASCDNAPAPGECSTAAQAVPFITKSFVTYNVTSLAEQAALISLMAFESGDFKYNRNHFPPPGRPGQGTRNMQSPTYNQQYAASIPALASQYRSVSGNVSAVLDLLLSDETYDFGSAAWFLTSQCTPAVRAALQSGSEAGWEGYITSCVGTTVTDDRKAYWTRAVQALGVKSQAPTKKMKMKTRKW